MSKLNAKAYKKIIELNDSGINRSKIAEIVGTTYPTIRKTLKMAQNRETQLLGMSDEDFMIELFGLNEYTETGKRLPDKSAISCKLFYEQKSFKECWEEYVKECINDGVAYYKYASFCKYFKDVNDINKAVNGLPGESVLVCWLPETTKFDDEEKTDSIYYFIAFFQYSKYCYIQAYEDNSVYSLINALNDLFTFVDGLPCKIITTKSNTTNDVMFERMREFYSLEVSYISLSKMKGLLQSANFIVKKNNDFYQNNIALYNEQLLKSVNAIKDINNGRSLYEIFVEYEKDSLANLPSYMFEIFKIKKIKVEYDSHINFEDNYYSAPWQYIGTKLEIHIFEDKIDLFNGRIFIASHYRSVGKGKYITDESHLPTNNDKIKINRNYFINQAKFIGSCTSIIIENILDRPKYEQQAYRECMSIINLVDGTAETNNKIEDASSYILSKNIISSYRAIKIAMNQLDKV
ncbi:hypothetical protein SAMN04487830_10797 [Pseudobutyrivibrio sp. OR37]|uniref:Mu transposase domain-containing protein n=1 Tax=Pseudobutyrivibrio sp. OR37 TaxID=1798186 RepID=UPI0008EAF0A7|nr:hypothetical protein [Pseudobutyrivibrio sp. OR37]SFH76028.1 hypothetical protein SAMN04487830_10797 [Pseudobutyrivibrio sp. OR37]